MTQACSSSRLKCVATSPWMRRCDTLIDLTEKVGRDGIALKRLSASKRQLLKRPRAVGRRHLAIAVDLSEWAAQGDWRLYSYLNRDRIEKVTPKEVQEVAARCLRRSNRTVGLFIPTEKPDRSPIPQSPDVEKVLAGYHGRQLSGGRRSVRRCAG